MHGWGLISILICLFSFSPNGSRERRERRRDGDDIDIYTLYYIHPKSSCCLIPVLSRQVSKAALLKQLPERG